MYGRVGGGDGFGGELVIFFDERFRGGDKGLSDVGRMLQQVHNDPEVLQNHDFCIYLVRGVSCGAHAVSINQNGNHVEDGF